MNKGIFLCFKLEKVGALPPPALSIAAIIAIMPAGNFAIFITHCFEVSVSLPLPLNSCRDGSRQVRGVELLHRRRLRLLAIGRDVVFVRPVGEVGVLAAVGAG